MAGLPPVWVGPRTERERERERERKPVIARENLQTHYIYITDSYSYVCTCDVCVQTIPVEEWDKLTLT